MTNLSAVMEQLRRPFDPSDIEWKPGATKGDRCMALAYGDLRAYMEALDEAVGGDWSVSYQPWGNERIIATVTIMGVSRSSTGEQDNTANGGTVAEAQAFKRACAMFGLGRFLYNLPQVWVGFDPGSKRITDQGLKELNDRYSAWYHKTIAKLKQDSYDSAANASARVEAPAPKVQEDVPMSSNPLDIWGPDAPTGLSKGASEFMAWCKGQAEQDPDTVSAAQYQYLVGTINKLTGREGSHNAILEALTLSVVDHDNLPSKIVGKELLDTLLEHNKNRETGEWVDNPRFRPEMVEIVKELGRYTEGIPA
jgi:hypothetical protein